MIVDYIDAHKADYGVEPIHRVHAENYADYMAHKVHAELNRQGTQVARCTAERLMRTAGLRGIGRTKNPRTTIAAPDTDRPADLVKRGFAPQRRTNCGLPTSPHGRVGSAGDGEVFRKNRNTA
ncbi:IS3 family transposase [Rhodococcus sp. C26F]